MNHTIQMLYDAQQNVLVRKGQASMKDKSYDVQVRE